MNEVKKSLDALSSFTSDDLDEVKQGVLFGKRRQKSEIRCQRRSLFLLRQLYCFLHSTCCRRGSPLRMK